MAATSAQFYANILKVFTPKVPNNVVYSAEMNEATDEIEAVELILGTGLRSKTVVAWDNVSTSWATLTARLNNMDAGIRTTDVSIHPQYALVSGALIQPADTTSVALTVRGAAANTHDLVQVFNTAGDSVMSATQSTFTVGKATTISASLVVTGVVSTTGSTTHTADVAATIPVTVKGASLQSGDLTQWQNSAGTVLAKVDSAGNLTSQALTSTSLTTSGLVSATAGLQVTGNTTSVSNGQFVVPQVVRGNAAQSSNLTQWQNSAGSVLAYVESNGNGYFPNLFSGSAATKKVWVSLTPTMNVFGEYDIITAIRSVTGWSVVDAVMMMNGDGNSSPNTVLEMMVGLPAGAGNMRAIIGNTGAVAANRTIRVNILAWGH